MITKLETFVINSYFCTKVNNKTNQINYNFDCPQGYLSDVTHMACIGLNIPNTWYQLDVTDSIILQEGNKEYIITYSDGNYNNKQIMMNDLGLKLTNASQIMGNNYIYTVTDVTSNINNGGMIITCNNNTTEKAIIINDNHLKIMYGLQSLNIFINNDTLKTGIINLNPIDQLYVHCSGVTSYNTSGLFSSDIIASLNIGQINQSFSLKGNMKRFSGQKNIIFSITDFDNELIDLNGNNWEMTLCLFKYEESFIEKLKLLIDYEVMKDQINNNENNYGVVQNY